MFKRKASQKRVTATGEPNLIPIMNLFVVLIPFLLITAAFEKFGGVNAEMPSLGDASSKSENSAQDKVKLELIFNLTNDRMNVTGWKDRFSNPLAEINKDFGAEDIQGFKDWFKEVEKQYPEVGITLFRADPTTRYELAIKWLGGLRTHPGLPQVVLAAEVQ